MPDVTPAACAGRHTVQQDRTVDPGDLEPLDRYPLRIPQMQMGIQQADAVSRRPLMDQPSGPCPVCRGRDGDTFQIWSAYSSIAAIAGETPAPSGASDGGRTRLAVAETVAGRLLG